MGPALPVGGLPIWQQQDCNLEVHMLQDRPRTDGGSLGDNYKGITADGLGFEKFKIDRKVTYDADTPEGLAAINNLGISVVKVDVLAAMELVNRIHDFDPDGTGDFFRSTAERYVAERPVLMKSIAASGYPTCYRKLEDWKTAGIFAASLPAALDGELGGGMHQHLDRMNLMIRLLRWVLKVKVFNKDDPEGPVHMLQVYDADNATLITIKMPQVILSKSLRRGLYSFSLLALVTTDGVFSPTYLQGPVIVHYCKVPSCANNTNHIECGIIAD